MVLLSSIQGNIYRQLFSTGFWSLVKAVIQEKEILGIDPLIRKSNLFKFSHC